MRNIRLIQRKIHFGCVEYDGWKKRFRFWKFRKYIESKKPYKDVGLGYITCQQRYHTFWWWSTTGKLAGELSKRYWKYLLHLGRTYNRLHFERHQSFNGGY
jgi:hypothetical protein